MKYSHASFIFFFGVVFYKRIYAFKTMAKYAKVHYRTFGFASAPDRKTIRRRFQSLPNLLVYAIAHIAIHMSKKAFSTFRFSSCFVDKSIFRSKGGVWYKQDMEDGVVPHPSIDTDASWAKSAYHKWRFGYGLHLIGNQFHFPISATVTTASVKDHSLLNVLLQHIHDFVGVVVGDKGYFAVDIMQNVYEK